MNLIDFLKPYMGRIYVISVVDEKFPFYKKNRNQFIYHGVLNGENMRQKFPEELVIEFDKKNKFCPDYLCRSESLFWMKKLRDILEVWKVRFHIVDHSGLSPHLRLSIKGLEDYPEAVRKEYKRLFLEDLLSFINFKPQNIKLDKAFAIKSNVPITLEDRPHWKKKYNGNIEKVIYENSYSSMRVQREKAGIIANSLCTSAEESYIASPVGFSFSSFKGLFNLYYAEGRRHYIVTAVAELLQKNGFSFWQAKDLILPLCSTNPQPNNGDLKDINYVFSNNYPVWKKNPTKMFEMALEDRNLGHSICRDFERCFTLEGGDL